jgi:hypothetical protein
VGTEEEIKAVGMSWEGNLSSSQGVLALQLKTTNRFAKQSQYTSLKFFVTTFN